MPGWLVSCQAQGAKGTLLILPANYENWVSQDESTFQSEKLK